MVHEKDERQFSPGQIPNFIAQLLSSQKRECPFEMADLLRLPEEMGTIWALRGVIAKDLRGVMRQRARIIRFPLNLRVHVCSRNCG
jgi:hypothetical protein